MRARQFRPTFDSLNSRLLLDGSGVLGAGLSAAASTSPSSISITGGWNLPSDPPPTPYNPGSPTPGGVD